MHNTIERTRVTLGLAGLCTLGCFSAVIPWVGVVLLVLVIVVVVGLIVAGTVALWNTRYQPPDRSPRSTATPMPTRVPATQALREVA